MLYRRILGLCIMVAVTGAEGASAQDCFLFFCQGAGRANPYPGPAPTQPPVRSGDSTASPLGAGPDRQYSAIYAPVEGELFPRWRGDLLVASLRGQTLFRARFREGHVVYLEPIVIGSRIRDLIEGHDGQIILWTDDDTLVSLRPKEGTSGESLFAEKCGGCHASVPMSGNFIGPNLIGVVGRRVASLGGYPDYSPTLRKLGGVWTEERLDVFLKAPGEACPGTAMDYAGEANDVERAAIISYLGTLRL